MYNSLMTTRHDESAADTLLATSRLLVAIAVRSLRAGDADVTVAQHRALVLLDEHGPLTVNQLAELLGVDQSNASRHARRLEHLGMVDRSRSEQDARSVEVSLTRAGKKQVAAVRAARRGEIEAVLARLSEDEVRVTVAAFSAFNDAAANG